MADVVTTNHPMHVGGAVPTARQTRLPEELRDPKKADDVRVMLEQTVATVVRYLETLMKAEQPMFSSDAECEVFCREKLEQHLMTKLEALLL
jgi:hypothetical protein